MKKKASIQDYLQWDTVIWKHALDCWEKEVDWSGVQHCLEIGGKKGGLALWLADKGKTVTCSDYRNVRDHAEPFHEQFDFPGSITYLDLDAANMSFENKYDLIVMKSVLGALGRIGGADMQAQVVLDIHRALKPGGYFLFAENMQASPLHGFLRKKFVRWSDWRYLKAKELEKFLEPFSSFKIASTGFSSTFGRTEGQRRLLGKADNLVLNRIVPDSWKFLSFGVAVK